MVSRLQSRSYRTLHPGKKKKTLEFPFRVLPKIFLLNWDWLQERSHNSCTVCDKMVYGYKFLTFIILKPSHNYQLIGIPILSHLTDPISLKNSSNPMLGSHDQYIRRASPTMSSSATNPQNLLSDELFLLSPIMK